MNRRELFSILSSNTSKKEEIIIRPPYFEKEDDFLKCVECDGKCKTVCPENIIEIQDDKTPVLNLLKRGCSYCDECAKVCEFDVLKLQNKKYLDIKVYIDEKKCLSHKGVMCFSCKDPCLDNAIDFYALFMPKINDKCTNCGFCIGVCPAEAIKIKKVS